MPAETPDALAACREAVDIFRSRGFRITAEKYEPKSFGNLLIDLASPTLGVRLTRDRGQHFIDVRRLDDSEWFDAHVVLAFLGSVDEANTLARNGWDSPHEVARAVSRHFGAIAAAFADDEYAGTKEALRRIERESAASRFGYEVPPNGSPN